MLRVVELKSNLKRNEFFSSFHHLPPNFHHQGNNWSSVKRSKILFAVLLNIFDNDISMSGIKSLLSRSKFSLMVCDTISPNVLSLPNRLSNAIFPLPTFTLRSNLLTKKCVSPLIFLWSPRILTYPAQSVKLPLKLPVPLTGISKILPSTMYRPVTYKCGKARSKEYFDAYSTMLWWEK